jgi:hypothetical protein
MSTLSPTKAKQLVVNEDTGKYYLVSDDGSPARPVNRVGQRPDSFDPQISGKLNFN